MGVKALFALVAAAALVAALTFGCAGTPAPPVSTPVREGVPVVVGRGAIGGAPWVATMWRDRNAFGELLCQRIVYGDRQMLGEDGDASDPCWRASPYGDPPLYFGVQHSDRAPTVVSGVMDAGLHRIRVDIGDELVEFDTVSLAGIGLDRVAFVQLFAPGTTVVGGDFLDKDGNVTLRDALP